MDDIKNYNPAEAETLDSREVAEMVGKQHKHLRNKTKNRSYTGNNSIQNQCLQPVCTTDCI